MRKSAGAKFALSVMALYCASHLSAQPGQNNQLPPPDTPRDQNDSGRAGADIERVSPVRRIERNRNPVVAPEQNSSFNAIDGSGNNLERPQTNAGGQLLKRRLNAAYSDGISSLAGADRPNPRVISNLVSEQNEDRPNENNATDYLWQWGQFLDHDIDLTDGADPEEFANIPIPSGDVWFDPNNLGASELPFNRSLHDSATGSSTDNPRQQINEITGWIDASNVYGSDAERAAALRTNDGSGSLRTSDGNLLPFNTEGFANAGGTSESLFFAGDVRANEQAGLTAMHTLWVREHNRLAQQILDNNPQLSGDTVYQRARARVAALLQVITYQEFLPLLLGENAIPRYTGYKERVDARIMNEFSTAAYRFGHSLLSPELLRLDEDFQEIPEGNLPLRRAFFAPGETSAVGIEPLLRGLAAQQCQNLDILVVDDLRNFLFGHPGNNGFDLVSLNIQRGRDHGLPSYNVAREQFGLDPVGEFAQISSDPFVQDRLEAAYGDVDSIDMWVGGLAEDHLRQGMMGELFARILTEQFTALRDGDRFWYQNRYSGRTLRTLEQTTLADVIRRNTNIGFELPEDVFRFDQGN